MQRTLLRWQSALNLLIIRRVVIDQCFVSCMLASLKLTIHTCIIFIIAPSILRANQKRITRKNPQYSVVLRHCIHRSRQEFNAYWMQKCESCTIIVLTLTFSALTCYHCTEQAWHPTASIWLGRRTSICNSMPDTNWTELCLQLHHYRPKRDSLLACSYLVAKVDSLRSYNHTSEA